MDGYAVRSVDAVRAATQLKVIGEVAAGRPFEKTVGPGEAVRIFTGGVIPNGADAVVIQEDTVVEGIGITITEAAAPGRHIRPAGISVPATCCWPGAPASMIAISRWPPR